MKQEKTLKDMNLLDRFLFAEAADDPEFVELLLEIILGKDIALKHLPQTEKENRSALWSKHIKLDVWAMDSEDTIYDAEVQNRNTGNLPKRTRFYHDLIGSRLLPPGTVDYNKLNDVFVIMIMPVSYTHLDVYKRQGHSLLYNSRDSFESVFIQCTDDLHIERLLRHGSGQSGTENLT